MACSSSDSAPPGGTDSGGTTDGGKDSGGTTDSATDGAGACGLSADPKATAITKLPASDAACPDLTVAQINAPESDAGPDGGGSECLPKFSATECKVTIACTEVDGDTTTVLSGTFTKDATGAVSGTLKLDSTPTGGTKLHCEYSISFK